MKSWLIWKDPDAGKDGGQEEKGTTEDEMVGWHHRLNGHGFGWTPGVGDREGGLACCSSWGCKESDTPERVNWTDGKHTAVLWSKQGNKEGLLRRKEKTVVASLSEKFKIYAFKIAKVLFLISKKERKFALVEIVCLFPMPHGLCPLEVTHIFLWRALEIKQQPHALLLATTSNRDVSCPSRHHHFSKPETLGANPEKWFFYLFHVWYKQSYSSS